MTADAETWVAQRVAGTSLRLPDEDRADVVATAAGLLPFLPTWERAFDGASTLPFPVTGRLRQPPRSPAEAGRPAGPRFEAMPTATGEDPSRTLIAAVRPADGHADTGLTFTVKANVDVAGITTGCGASPRNPAVPANPASRSAPVVDALLAAGAHLVGIANLGELALDATSDNPWHGRVDNPAVPGHCPGGSSGGSAAGIAAGAARLSVGSDSAGSVRIPAAFCGVYGYRPTPGRTSLGGLRGAAWSIDTVGFMADSLTTLQWAAEVTASVRSARFRGRPRIGVLLDAGMGAVQPAVDRQYRAVLDRLDGIAELVPVQLGGVIDAPAVAAVIAYAEAAAQLRSAVEQAPEEFGRPPRQLVQFGALVSSQDYLLAQRMRTVIAERWDAAVANVDAVLTPTVPMLPFLHGATPHIPLDDSALAIFAMIRFTAVANVAALPAIAIPVGSADGPPFGVQLTGRHDEDETLFGAAARVVEACA